MEDPNPSNARSDPPAQLPALSLRQMRYFVTLARALNFTQAAQQMAVTQPALTSAMRQIETVLGGRLFVRSAQGLTLTAAGAAALPLAEHLLNTARSSFDDMRRTMTEDRQTVRIGLIPSVAGRLFPAVASLRAAHPTLRLDLRDLPNGALIQAVRDGSVDFGIGVDDEPGAGAGIVCQDLFQDEIMAVLRSDDPLAQVPEVSWAHLAERQLAVFNRGNVSDLLLRTAARSGLRLRPGYRMEYTEPLYALVRSGLAVAVLPGLYTRHLHEAELTARLLHAPQVSRTIALLSLDQPGRGPQVDTARAWVARNL